MVIDLMIMVGFLAKCSNTLQQIAQNPTKNYT